MFIYKHKRMQKKITINPSPFKMCIHLIEIHGNNEYFGQKKHSRSLLICTFYKNPNMKMLLYQTNIRLICNVIDYTTRNHGAMVHEGKKPFCCSVCDNKCSQKRNLTQHIAIRTYTNIRPGFKKCLRTKMGKRTYCILYDRSYALKRYHIKIINSQRLLTLNTLVPIRSTKLSSAPLSYKVA